MNKITRLFVFLTLLLFVHQTIADVVYFQPQVSQPLYNWDDTTIWVPNVPSDDDTVIISLNDTFDLGIVFIQGVSFFSVENLVVESSLSSLLIDVVFESIENLQVKENSVFTAQTPLNFTNVNIENGGKVISNYQIEIENLIMINSTFETVDSLLIKSSLKLIGNSYFSTSVVFTPLKIELLETCNTTIDVNFYGNADCKSDFVIMNNYGTVYSVPSDDVTLLFCSGLINNYGTWIHNSPGITFTMSTLFSNTGSFIVQSGTFRIYPEIIVFHYGNFTVFPEGNLILRGDHDIYGNVVGSIVFEEGTFNIYTENFANELTATGAAIRIYSPLHFSSVTLNSASALVLQSSVVIGQLTNNPGATVIVDGNSILNITERFIWSSSNVDGGGLVSIEKNCTSIWSNPLHLFTITVHVYGNVTYDMSSDFFIELYLWGRMLITGSPNYNCNFGIYVQKTGELYFELENTGTLNTTYNFINNGVVAISTGSVDIWGNSVVHGGKFLYNSNCFLSFSGIHNFIEGSTLQGGSNLKFRDGYFTLSGSLVGDIGYIHGYNALVIFNSNVTFNLPMEINSGGVKFLKYSSFNNDLTLSSTMDIENCIVTTYKKFNLLSSGVITGSYGQLNLRNDSYFIGDNDIVSPSLSILNYGTFYINNTNNLKIETFRFHNHRDIVLLDGNLALNSIGLHNGRFMCNVTLNSTVTLGAAIEFSSDSKFFGNTLQVSDMMIFNGTIGIKQLEVSGNVTMNSPFRTNGTVIVSDGTVRFNDDVTINTLQISGTAVVHLPNEMNFLKNLEISGTSANGSLVTYPGSTVVIDTSMILTGDIGGSGRLIFNSNTVTDISDGTITASIDNYGTFTVQSLTIGNLFVNHKSSSINLLSNAVIGDQNGGKIINYGSITSEVSESNVETSVDIINYGLVSLDTWSLVEKNYTQVNGETHFSNLTGGKITHNGGGFYSNGNGSLTTTNGYYFNEGTIFPGGKNVTGTLTIYGNVYYQGFTCVTEFDISTTSNDKIYINNNSPTQQLTGTFHINDDRKTSERYTLVYATSLVDSSVHIYSSDIKYDKNVTDNSFGIRFLSFTPDTTCDNCAFPSNYCLSGGICQCFAGLSHSCACSLENCDCVDQGECKCPSNNIGTPFCQVTIPSYPLIGCIDSNATNYDPIAEIDDNSCHYDYIDLTYYPPVIPSTTTTSQSTGLVTSSVTSTGLATSSGVTTGPGSTTGNEPSPVQDGDSSSDPNDDAVVIGVTVGVLAFVIILIVIAILFYRRKSKKSRDPENPTTIPMEPLESHGSNVSVEKFRMKNITVQERLGGGNFGDVFKGLWKVTPVALKKLKNEEQMNEFFKEAEILHGLRHQNIVQFFGIYIDSNTNNQYMVTEFMSKGSVTQLFNSEEKLNITIGDIITMALDSAAGMAYLHEMNIIHCDLALRNLLVSSGSNSRKYQVKVADFGMSKTITNVGLYSRVNENDALPIKWTALEVLEYGKYSYASDVWSFGVVLYELFTRGKLPYAGWTNKETMEYLKKGVRLEQPDECPTELYEIMLKCWNEDPTMRPTFEVLCEEINGLLTKSDRTERKETNEESSNSDFNYQSNANYKSNDYIIFSD